MIGKIRTRLALLVALAALTAVLVPATLAFGSHVSDPVAGSGPEYVFLQLGNTDQVRFGTQFQPISTNKNRCTVVGFGSPQLLIAKPFGGALGHVDNSIGVQSQGDGNGSPCSWIEASDGEAISLKLGSAMSSYLMTAVDVDLELKGNATVAVTYWHDGTQITQANDTFDPMSPSDDGPDSGDLDNWRYFHRPTDGSGKQIYFDEVKFTPVQGTLSLEGGSDGTDNGLLVTTNNWSQFEVYSVFDGQITCGEDNGIMISNPAFPATGSVVMRSLDLDDVAGGYDISCTQKKNYNDSVGEDSLAYLPETGVGAARYTIVLTIPQQPVDSDNGSGVITTLQMQYSALGDFTDLVALEACVGQPELNSSDAEYETFWEGDLSDFFPGDDTACYYKVDLAPSGLLEGTNRATETWHIAFEGDPGFSFR